MLASPARLIRRSIALPLAVGVAAACAHSRTETTTSTSGSVAASTTTSATSVSASSASAMRAATPRVFMLRPEALQVAKKRLVKGDTALRPALDKLLRDAEKAMQAPLVSVADKRTLLPPSGSRNDYFSLSPYWWPDTTKPDGLPYIRRDGVTNPESKRDLDQPRVAALGYSLQTLGLAYWFTGKEEYAARAAEQLRTWFLNPATRMTPHLRFAQLVRGIDRERGSGIIDTRWFIETIDAVGLIEGSRHWTAADQRGMEEWFAAYLNWLRTSPNGAHEQKARNNHGSWFAAQTAAMALFTGDTATAREIVEGAKARIGWQITPEGQQPIELERTRSMHYASFNIEALSRVAEMGRQLDVDLWHYEAPEGGSLRKAIDHLVRYVPDPSKWPGQQIDPIDLDLLYIHLRRADTVYGGEQYAAILRQLPTDAVRRDRSALLYP